MKKFDKLYLHVGLEKTGTTTIQRALHQGRDRLEKLGYLYPKCFAVGRNTYLAAMVHLKAMERPSFRSLIDQNGGTIETFSKTMLAQLEAEINHTKARNLILSSEFLAAHCDIAQLNQLFSRYANEIQIILYLREQSSLILSMHSTSVKGGKNKFGAMEKIERGELPRFLNFKWVLERIEAEFDRSQIQVRIFETGRLLGGDVLEDFLALLGLGKYAKDFRTAPENQSLSQASMDLLKRVNDYFPNFKDGQRDYARVQFIKDIEALDKKSTALKPSMSQDLDEKVRALSSLSNEWVRQNYFSDQATLFTHSARIGTDDPSNEAALAYASQLLTQAYRKIWALEEELRNGKKH